VFGINGLEFVALGVIAMLLLGPDKLPRYAAEAGRFLRQMRRMAASAQSEVRRELGPEFQDISISDLNPRKFVAKHLMDDSLDDLTDLGLDDRPARRGGNGSSSLTKGNGSTSLSKGTGSTSLSKGGSTAADDVDPPAPREAAPRWDADAT
jgi:sec-independent protein translocase protein TatB